MNTHIIKTVLFALMLGFPVAAHASDPFTVADVPVDATGSSALEAQTKAISEGQIRAATRLMDRLTLASQRASNPVGTLESSDVARLIRALEISNERRSAQRYLGDVTIAFSPSEVQSFLRQRNLTMISTQAQNRLVVPLIDGGQMWSSSAWNQAWQSARFAHALTPVTALRPSDSASLSSQVSATAVQNADDTALQVLGQRYGVRQILIADARASGASVSVSLQDISLDTGRVENLGRVSGSDYTQAAQAVISKLEENWKSASVSLSGRSQDMVVSVLYNSHRDWQRLQDVINTSAQIQDARLDALSKDGALMTLVYGGDFQRLANELSFKGVSIERDPAMGVVLSLSGRRRR